MYRIVLLQVKARRIKISGIVLHLVLIKGSKKVRGLHRTLATGSYWHNLKAPNVTRLFKKKFFDR